MRFWNVNNVVKNEINAYKRPLMKLSFSTGNFPYESSGIWEYSITAIFFT